jgi:hypothetical protein
MGKRATDTTTNANKTIIRPPKQHSNPQPLQIYIKHPPGAISLQGLALNFCINHRYPTNKIQRSIDRFTNDIRTKHLLTGSEDLKDFIPQLYIKDLYWKSPPAKPNIEQ